MDPNAALLTITDPTVDTAERITAGHHLAAWLHNGGFIPTGLLPHGVLYPSLVAARAAARRITAERIAQLAAAAPITLDEV